MHAADARAHYSAGTTKGTGGDVIILEEAAYVSQDFFYETVAPLLLVGVTTLICISTLTSELSFYTRLFKIKDPVTGLPVFAQFQVSLACDACKDAGMAASCRHMLHLVPTWQSSVRHERLKAVMADRPDLIQSELSGLAFDSLQQCFRGHDITTMLSAPVPTPLTWSQVLLFSSYYDWDRTTLTAACRTSSWSSTPPRAGRRATLRSSPSSATAGNSWCVTSVCIRP